MEYEAVLLQSYRRLIDGYQLSPEVSELQCSEILRRIRRIPGVCDRSPKGSRNYSSPQSRRAAE